MSGRAWDAGSEHLLRDLTPQVLGAVMRRFRDFAAAEDAVQEALVAAAMQWPGEGIPQNPRGWLIQVASRRLTDHVRSESARRRRESVAAVPSFVVAPAADVAAESGHDDTLILLFMCCHPALTPSSAIALTLRAVGGLTTAEIASAFLVPEATMAQRISRAKQSIKASGVPFSLPTARERAERLRAVLHVLYLIFNEGYTSSGGAMLQRTELSREAIRLARAVLLLLPLHAKAAGLLALKPDIAVISECAEPERLRLRGATWLESEPVWIGRNPHKGLAVFGFNGHAVRLAESYQASLHYVAPVHVDGPVECNLLAVWAQNASSGSIRKRSLGPLRRALSRYREFLSHPAALIAGDLNSNTIWDKPGWRINHSTKVRILEDDFGLVSAWHAVRGELHGQESVPTLYWRDRTKDGPTYHIDYVFLPSRWTDRAKVEIGTFESWCTSGLSDHAPVIVDVEL